MDFLNVEVIRIPEGDAIKIIANGVVLWEAVSHNNSTELNLETANADNEELSL